MNILLSKRELGAFDDEFKWVTSHHNWRIENIFTSGSHEELKVMNVSRWISTEKNKLSRRTVATHESGHVVVIAASHGVVGKAVIDVKDHPSGVLGWVERGAHTQTDESDYCLPEEGQKFDLPCKPIIVMDLLMNAGGFVGESFTGKRTGSNHEKFLVYCKCRYLDDLHGLKPLTSWNHYVGWCRRIILNNEVLFWRITDALLENSELTERAKILLHDRIKREPTELFFN